LAEWPGRSSCHLHRAGAANCRCPPRGEAETLVRGANFNWSLKSSPALDLNIPKNAGPFVELESVSPFWPGGRARGTVWAEGGDRKRGGMPASRLRAPPVVARVEVGRAEK